MKDDKLIINNGMEDQGLELERERDDATAGGKGPRNLTSCFKFCIGLKAGHMSQAQKLESTGLLGFFQFNVDTFVCEVSLLTSALKLLFRSSALCLIIYPREISVTFSGVKPKALQTVDELCCSNEFPGNVASAITVGETPRVKKAVELPTPQFWNAAIELIVRVKKP